MQEVHASHAAGRGQLVSSSSIAFAAGLCYMCAREQAYWTLTPVQSVEAEYHTPAPQGMQYQATGVPVDPNVMHDVDI